MMTKEELEQRIRTGIPLASQMDFRVRELTPNSIIVTGGAAQNINVHQTAFAGSLYTLCTLAVWGLVTSRLPQNMELMMAEGRILYRKPVVGEIVAECKIGMDAFEGFLGMLKRRGKGRLKAKARVECTTGCAVEFSGVLYARQQ